MAQHLWVGPQHFYFCSMRILRIRWFEIETGVACGSTLALYKTWDDQMAASLRSLLALHASLNSDSKLMTDMGRRHRRCKTAPASAESSLTFQYSLRRSRITTMYPLSQASIVERFLLTFVNGWNPSEDSSSTIPSLQQVKCFGEWENPDDEESRIPSISCVFSYMRLAGLILELLHVLNFNFSSDRDLRHECLFFVLSRLFERFHFNEFWNFSMAFEDSYSGVVVRLF